MGTPIRLKEDSQNGPNCCGCDMSDAKHRDGKRREDFPLDSFRYLEAKMQELRKRVMDRAAELAEVTGSQPDVYRVEKQHVDKALAELLLDSESALYAIGLKEQHDDD